MAKSPRSTPTNKPKPRKPPSLGENISRLSQLLGADVAVNQLPVQPWTSVGRRRINAKLYNQFLQGNDRGDSMYDFSESAPLISIVWDRPNTITDASRRLMRRTLVEAHVWEPVVSHLWCCPVPGKAATTTELATFRPWLLEGVQAAGARHVLLVGSRALWMWRPELRLSTTQYGQYLWRQRQVVMPVLDPAGCTKAEFVVWQQAVVKFARAAKADEDYLVQGGCHAMVNKVTCVEAPYWYDSDGVGWCRGHAEDGVKAQEKGVEKWRQLTTQAGQQSLC